MRSWVQRNSEQPMVVQTNLVSAADLHDGALLHARGPVTDALYLAQEVGHEHDGTTYQFIVVRR